MSKVNNNKGIKKSNIIIERGNNSKELFKKYSQMNTTDIKNNNNKNLQTIEGVILFTDIVDSTNKWKQFSNERQMEKAVKKLDKYVKSSKYLQNGKNFIVKTIGDAYMIYFEKSIEALDFSTDLQIYLNDPGIFIEDNVYLKVRIGMAYGQFLKFKQKIQNCTFVDFLGTIVNIASRMESKVSGNYNNIAFNLPFFIESLNIFSIIPDLNVAKSLLYCDATFGFKPTTPKTFFKRFII